MRRYIERSISEHTEIADSAVDSGEAWRSVDIRRRRARARKLAAAITHRAVSRAASLMVFGQRSSRCCFRTAVAAAAAGVQKPKLPRVPDSRALEGSAINL